MKIAYFTIALLPFLMFLRGCAQDSQEVNNDNFEVHYEKNDLVTKEMAIESWEMFLIQTQDKINNAETNLSALEMRIEEDAPQDHDIREKLNKCNLALLKLKSKRAARNKAFSAALVRYDPSGETQYENEIFIERYNDDLETLNTAIGQLLEQMRSGYYK